MNQIGVHKVTFELAEEKHILSYDLQALLYIDNEMEYSEFIRDVTQGDPEAVKLGLEAGTLRNDKQIDVTKMRFMDLFRAGLIIYEGITKNMPEVSDDEKTTKNKSDKSFLEQYYYIGFVELKIDSIQLLKMSLKELYMLINIENKGFKKSKKKKSLEEII